MHQAGKIGRLSELALGTDTYVTFVTARSPLT